MTNEKFQEEVTAMVDDCQSKTVMIPVYTALILDNETATIRLANCPTECRQLIEIPDDMYTEQGRDKLIQIASKYNLHLDVPTKQAWLDWLNWIAQEKAKKEELLNACPVEISTTMTIWPTGDTITHKKKVYLGN
jgi:hypothetical protein